jgi:MarR family transcriptional regulator, organic hydroperoxide resistance regulator
MSRPTHRLIHLLSLAQHRLLKSADVAFKDALGISTTQLGVLFLLEQSPGMLFKDVGDELGVNASAITALVARMEEASLVRRRPSSDDQRAMHLFATANGLAKAAAARPILARLNARLTGDFTEREMATVARFLNAILDRF